APAAAAEPGCIGTLPTRRASDLGIFSEEFSRSYYAAIGRRDANILLRNASDVAQYRLGYVAGASIEAMLQKVVPEAQLQLYDNRSEEHTAELQYVKTSYAVFCLK